MLPDWIFYQIAPLCCVVMFVEFSRSSRSPSRRRSHSLSRKGEARDLFDATAIENFEMLKSEIFVNIFLSRPSSNINTIDGNKPGPFILPNFEKFSGTDPNI